MKINDFLYASLILEILYLSSTEKVISHDPQQKIMQIWPERVKLNFVWIK